MFHAESPLTRGTIVVLLALVVCVGPVLATPAAPDAEPEKSGTRVVMVSAPGENTVDETGSTAYVWAGESTDVVVTYTVNGSTSDTRVCLIPEQGGTGTCQPATAGEGFQRVTFSDVSVPAEDTTFRVTIVRDSGAENESTGVIAKGSINVTAIEKTGDLDGDGLTNEDEVKHHTFVHDTDTDNDGLQDGPEVHEYQTDPLTADTDGDGLRDAVEINGKTDPVRADTDADGLSDAEEVDEYDTDPTAADTDGDGLQDGKEVEVGSDPTAVDTDGDTLDDALELQLNTNPAGVWSPLGWVLLALIGAFVVVGLRFGNWNTDRFTGGESTSDGSSDSPDPPPRPQQPTPPRTDREEVLALLEENDGKLRQSNIVERTDWSKAKVSRLLARLDDNGDITKIRLGRENVICLPGQEPEGSKPRTDR